ncbi:helix-turn-helix domain-containing protein [Citricoccus sp. NR2]|uniref:helix-turn-helix domain-containing protein n=1 Tax=Citricoccus sp. NR2 TaxID=3004095 RepID=UPI0022DD1817|nr:helix-turn-helix domain-containing protein [Citricoccus sp. NR2]WBL18764.1 helix-turn-helix domain-containing protein [Citricoccus sp. NR2]
MSIQAINWARQVGGTGVLRAPEILVLWQLADMADEAWSCWPSQSSLARDTNQSLRTINTQIGRLKTLGLLRVESRHGTGGGRIGMRYYLQEEALFSLSEAAEEDATTETQASENNPNAETAYRENERHAESAHRENNLNAEFAYRTNKPHAKSAHRENEGHAESAVRSPKRRIAYDLNADSRFGHYKERARINPHESSSVDERAHQAPGPVERIDDDDDDRIFHRGVDLTTLAEQLGVDTDDHVLAARVVNVVLDRATTVVKAPARYVARAVETDRVGLVAEARATLTPSQPDTAQGSGPSVPVTEPVVHTDAVPCTNPDHWGSGYNLTNCPACRGEAKTGQKFLHVDDLTEDQIDRLPERFRDWARSVRGVNA